MFIFREPEGISYRIKSEHITGKIVPLAFSDVEVPIEKIFSGQILND